MHRLNPGRQAAILYLLASLPAFFTYMYVEPSLIVSADAAATARRVLGSETLFRLGIAAELTSSIAFIFLVLSLYRLFRKVDPRKAMVMVILVLVSVPISLTNVANDVAALRLLKGGAALAAIGASQLQSMAMLFLRIHGAGVFIAQIFWGLWLLPLGMLVRRSGFVPAILGTLLMINGVAYPVVTLIWLFAPSYTTAATQVALLPQLGEAWFISWLLIKGVSRQTIDDAAQATALPHAGRVRPQFAAALLLVIAPFCATAKAQSGGAEALYDRGRGAVDSGDPRRAAKLFADAIAVRPNEARYHVQLGDAYEATALSAGMFERMGLIGKAKAEWDRAVALDPNSIAARESLVEFYAMAPAVIGGSERMAREQADEIAKRDAIEGHRAKARIYTLTGRPDLARNEYAEMLKTYGSSARAHYRYGVYLLGTEKNDRVAAAEFESAARLDPAYMPAYFQIGHAAAISRQSVTHGEESLKKYLRYRPKEDEPPIARAHYWLGMLYEMDGRKAEAEASYAASLALNPNQKDVETARNRVRNERQR